MSKKVKLLKMSNFNFFNNVFYAICIFKSFNSHISVVVCSFFDFGTVLEWCIRERVNARVWPNILAVVYMSYCDATNGSCYLKFWN